MKTMLKVVILPKLLWIVCKCRSAKLTRYAAATVKRKKVLETPQAWAYSVGLSVGVYLIVGSTNELYQTKVQNSEPH